MPPVNWDDCAALLDSPQLDRALQVRLVQLSFGSNESVAVKAIEILRGMPLNRQDDLTGIPTEQLLEAENRAREYIRSIGQKPNNGADGHENS